MKLIYTPAKLIHSLRTKRIIDDKLDIRDCAKKIGVSAATLSRIENGKTPDVNTLATVCKWVPFSLDECFSPLKKISTKPKKQ